MQTRLSERVIVDLVNKLKQVGLFGDELLHTINGREYITKAQVQEEVKQSLAAAGGRLPVLDLPALLGVDLVYCEAEATNLINVRSPAVPTLPCCPRINSFPRINTVTNTMKSVRGRGIANHRMSLSWHACTRHAYAAL